MITILTPRVRPPGGIMPQLTVCGHPAPRTVTHRLPQPDAGGRGEVGATGVSTGAQTLIMGTTHNFTHPVRNKVSGMGEITELDVMERM